MEFEQTILKLAKKYLWINRVLGFVVAGLLITYGAITFKFDQQFNYVILQLYYFLFAGLILLGEFNFKSMLRIFAFLGNLFGKGLFFALIGLSMLGNTFSFASILGVIIIAIGAFYILAFFIPNKILQAGPNEYADGTPVNNNNGAA